MGVCDCREAVPEVGSPVRGPSLKCSTCKRPVNDGCWTLSMNLGPVNNKASFLTGVFLCWVNKLNQLSEQLLLWVAHS